MSLLSDLKDDLLNSVVFKDVALAFTEISFLRIKRLRASFEKNTRFYKEITDLYHIVKENSAKLQKKARKKEALSTIRIAVTSNSHFYGNLTAEVMRVFLEDIKKNTGDGVMVIGQTGISNLLLKLNPEKFQALRFESDFPLKKEVLSVIDQTVTYGRVLLYYPKFLSILSQKASVLDITQTTEPEKTPSGKIEYIFEPELSKIVDFFEKQVRSLLFIRTIMETELSRTAARLMSMSSAGERAEELIKGRKVAYYKAAKSLRNARLLETFSSIVEWGQDKIIE